MFPEWERIADDTVSILRIEAGRRPDDPALIALVGLPLIGQITLPFENLTVDVAGDQVLTVFTPQPGSPEHDAIRLLASWNAHASISEDAESSSDT
jgi:hypothetical protein